MMFHIQPHRDYYQRLGAILRAIEESPKPMTVWRLTYAARLTARVADASVEELEAYGLIRCVDLDGLTSNKRGPRKYGEVGSYLNPTSKFLEITAKGRKFLEVMEKMAALMPKAPWIMEQY